MDYLSQLISLPLTDPVLIFSLVLLIILCAPLLFDRLHIPHIVGLILAGVLFGEYGLGVLSYDKSIQLFGQVGMLYIMFIAGIDMDMNDFMHNRNKSLVFGAYTFFIPVLFGLVTGFILMYIIFTTLSETTMVEWISNDSERGGVIRYSMFSAIVLASMFASNTLLAYPIVSRYGITRNKAVTITVGGTMVSMLLSLIVLAVVLQVANGDVSLTFWIKFILSLVIYSFIVFYIFPKLTSWFFKHHADSILQYIFVLALVLLSSFLAKLAGMEYIIGAFLAGISINRLIPKRSPLMNRINFVGNAIFIPFFLIGVGMIVDIKLIFSGYTTIVVALIMTAVATISKYLAALATQKTYRLSKYEGTLMFGLSNAKAAYSLVAVMLAYNCVIGTTALGNDIRLFTNEIVNGTIIMILFTCIISSVVTERSSKKIVSTEITNTKKASEYRPEMRILIPVSNQNTLEKLMELAVILNDNKHRQPMYALNVVDYQSVDEKSSDSGDVLLERAAYIGASSDNKVKKIKRYDLNIASGITNVVREKNISDIVMGISSKATLTETLFGSLYDTILESVNRMVYILSYKQPLSLANKIVLVVPDGAEKESGFKKWCHSVRTIASQSNAKIEVHTTKNSYESILSNFKQQNSNIKPNFAEQEKITLSQSIASLQENDLLIVISSRKQSISYQVALDGIIKELVEKVKDNTFIIIYPEQFKEGEVDNLQESTNTKII